MLLRRRRWTIAAQARPLPVEDARVREWIAETGLTPTGAQERALADVRADIAKTTPMSRLLLGDVGSGKTLVAAIAMRIAADNGYQSVMMAPTELLAEQHLATLRRYFGDAGPRTILLSGSLKAKEARESREMIAGGLVDVIVGTHAVLESDVAFASLALAVVDEQHRFGVRQRSLLREKGRDPHVLLTTATPIPRTLTQTIY